MSNLIKLIFCTDSYSVKHMFISFSLSTYLFFCQGFVEWRLCPNDNIDQDPDQDCFDREDAALVVEETGDTKFWIEDAWGAGKVSTRVRLPMMECAQCVLQWTYRSVPHI